MTLTHITRFTTTAVLAGSLALVGCAKKPAAPKAPAASETAAEKPAAKIDPVGVPDGARVMFLSPAEGAVISGEPKDGKVTVHVKMGAKGIKVQAAGKVEPGTGHHHIIINAATPALGEPVPKDATHIHYGKGQTETDLHLVPGAYTLNLQFANGVHQSYGPKLSATIHVTVASTMQPGAAAAVPAAAVPAAAPAAAVPAAAVPAAAAPAAAAK